MSDAKDLKESFNSDDNENIETLPTKTNNNFIYNNDLIEQKCNQMTKDEEEIYDLHQQMILQYKTLKRSKNESSFVFSCTNSRKEENIDNNKETCIIVWIVYT